MVLVKRCVAILFILVGRVVSAYASPSISDCITAEEVKLVESDFFSKLPHSDAFGPYKDYPGFRIFTNVIDGADLERKKAASDEKLAWFAAFIKKHPRLFVSGEFKVRYASYTFIKGRLRGVMPSVENIQTSRKFPKHECVEHVTYELPSSQCVMAQYIRNFSVDFVKEGGKLKLGGVEMYFDLCSQ